MTAPGWWAPARGRQVRHRDLLLPLKQGDPVLLRWRRDEGAGAGMAGASNRLTGNAASGGGGGDVRALEWAPAGGGRRPAAEIRDNYQNWLKIVKIGSPIAGIFCYDAV